MACWLFALLACALNLHAAETSSLAEYEVKAGYLFNFARYIEWPGTAFPTTNSPFVVGVLDGGEALPVLERIYAGKNINGHPLRVKAVSGGSHPQDVHILLVTRAAGKTPEEVRGNLGRAATLVVGETEQFAERGGMIGFVREEDAIRLTLNLERAAEAGLKVNAKLSTVAKVVRNKNVK